MLARVLGVMAFAGLVAEMIGLYGHARYLNTDNGEGGASHYVQSTTFGKTYLLRNGLLVASAVLALAVALLPLATAAAVSALVLLAIMSVTALLIGRALFYVLVIPTTMPGAFFWKNKGFEDHARDIGLANMPQVGVVPHLH
jgi:DMSO reductase anchor subunit